MSRDASKPRRVGRLLETRATKRQKKCHLCANDEEKSHLFQTLGRLGCSNLSHPSGNIALVLSAALTPDCFASPLSHWREQLNEIIERRQPAAGDAAAATTTTTKRPRQSRWSARPINDELILNGGREIVLQIAGFSLLERRTRPRCGLSALDS